MMISRAWAMPNASTFTIKPIAALLDRYVPLNGEGWADPFAGWASPAEWTNDLNPELSAKSHCDARAFASGLPAGLTGVLFDPPYSPRQIAEVYKSVGLAVGVEDTQNGRLYSETRDLLAPKIEPGGIAISCGWNSSGFGRARGFKIVEILMVCHGGAHNDTIVTVESKIQESLSLLAGGGGS